MSNETSRQRARELRLKASKAERLLWSRLRKRQVGGHRFRRQHPLGSYIVDFVCLEQKVVVEVDGDHHGEDQQKAHDERRDAWITAQGYRVVRFSIYDIYDGLEFVVGAIDRELG
ncbi:MAG: endonuclease domain-containing protein [Alphaproteobacteria bacterium]|nr:endonuclease domain-containing protein [Alphaproteobacteria bacterium]